VQLIDGSALWQKMRRSLGSKRREMSDDNIALVTRLFGDAAEARLATITDAEGRSTVKPVSEGEAPPQAPEGGKVRLAPLSRLFRNEAFGYRSITVERSDPCGTRRVKSRWA
jgi:type I restriction enzyme M protein